MIYLDNAATTPVDGAVFKAMQPYFCEIYGNPQSQHAAGRLAAKALNSARDKVAELFGCRAEETYFLSGGTEAGNWALKGACAAQSGKHIVISAIEHHALLESAEDMRRYGYEVTYVKPGADGIVSSSAVLSALRPDTAFCAVALANNELGTIQPAEEIGEICKARGVFYYCDCVQTAGVLPFPVKHCDMFAVSAHKFYGPKGIGAAFVNEKSHIYRLISGGRQERGMRGGTSYVAGAVGLACALENAVNNSGAVNAYVRGLRDEFLREVESSVKNCYLNGDRALRLPSNANISFEGCEGANIVIGLDMEGVCASAGAACAAGASAPSHVVTAVAGRERAVSAVRFTFGKYNTEEEVKLAAAAVKKVVGNIRGNKA